MSYHLLDSFRGLFEREPYLHRRSNLGDMVAMRLYEDLHAINRSKRLVERIDEGIAVLNTQNVRRGVKARRGDGSFGEIIPHVDPIKDESYVVSRGPIATIEIGIEVKILFKAMIKQIDRVINDLRNQVDHFKSRKGSPICVGIVGINRADHCTSYEGERTFPTNGGKYKHPLQEADEAEHRLFSQAAPAFDEFLVLRFKATNEPPYTFAWDDENATELDYGAILVRISQQYEKRF